MTQTPAPIGPNGKPMNVVLIMSDQHHKSVLGCAGDPLVRTPALDRLASTGYIFQNASCNFPLCGPSRAAFMTGQLASRINVLTNECMLRSDDVTFAHGFNAAGYQTVLSGRMHFVGPDQWHGYQTRLVSDCMASSYLGLDGWRLKPVLDHLSNCTGFNRHNITTSGPGRSGYMAYDEHVTEQTAKWIAARPATNDARPFMLTVGYVLPHCPFVGPREDFDFYYKHMTDDSFAGRPVPGQQSPGQAGADLHPVYRQWQTRFGLDAPLDADTLRRVRAAYYAMCSHLDRQIGQVVSALDAAGLRENTIIVYTSDHGEQLGEQNMWWKGSFYEGSVGVPLIINVPASFKAAAGFTASPEPVRIKENVSLIDIGPTLLDLCGAPKLPIADGRSFKCLLQGQSHEWQDEVVSEYFSNDSAIRMVRQADWKYLCFPGHESQLFNLASDPGELVNRISDPTCRDIIEKLHARAMENWDPAGLTEQKNTRQLQHKLYRAWVTNTTPAEPVPIWLAGRTTPVENYIEPVEPPKPA